MSKSTLREQVAALLKARDLNATDVGCYVSLSQTTVCNFLSGRSDATPRITSEMSRFLARVEGGEILGPGAGNIVSIEAGAKRSRRRAGQKRTFYETEMVKRTASAIDYAADHSAIVLVSADFGAGKTEATKLWRRGNRDTDSVLFEFDTFTSSHIYEFLTSLAAQLGMDADAYYHNSGKVFRMVVERLREQPTVLIFDQCEMVRIRILQLIRQLWDQTKEDGVAVVLLAAPQLYHRLERGRGGDLGALRSRIGAHVNLRGLTRGDMAAILKQEGITKIDDEAAAVWFQAIGGSMRWFMEGIDLLKARHGGKLVTERTIAGILRTLMGVSIGGRSVTGTTDGEAVRSA